MPNEDRAAIMNEANELGLEFPSNIPTVKLQNMIDEAKAEKSDNQPDELVFTSAPNQLEGVVMQKDEPEEVRMVRRAKDKRKRIAERKKAAMKTRIVTITNKDNRDNDFTTTAHLSMENQHFGIAKNVPLDTPVELEQCLIDIAESTMITQHRDEIIRGQRTGNKVPISVKKYVVSYSSQDPE